MGGWIAEDHPAAEEVDHRVKRFRPLGGDAFEWTDAVGRECRPIVERLGNGGVANHRPTSLGVAPLDLPAVAKPREIPSWVAD